MTKTAPSSTPNHRQPHGALILLVTMLIVSGINYALNTVLTRLLEPDDIRRAITRIAHEIIERLSAEIQPLVPCEHQYAGAPR
ncbi:MAG: hypothetical protein HC933_20365, partial [Pleurocapsa sp. SU_196_0]|nr:hypothetical protein [Pleurocapsa sp. SU_196_0]